MDRALALNLCAIAKREAAEGRDHIAEVLLLTAKEVREGAAEIERLQQSVGDLVDAVGQERDEVARLTPEIERLQKWGRLQAEDIMTLGQQVGKAEAEVERLQAAHQEIIRIKDDTLGPRGGIKPLEGQEHFDRGCRMAFYRCADISARALATCDVQEAPALGFEDPRVQIVYELLCDPTEPPGDEHWEGFVARRIVHSLVQQREWANCVIPCPNPSGCNWPACPLDCQWRPCRAVQQQGGK